MSKKSNFATRSNRVRHIIKKSSRRHRLSVFRSSKHIVAQLIDQDNGKILASSSTMYLKLKNNNIESAKKVGTDIGAKISKIGIKNVVFDRSGFAYHGRIQALAESVKDQGVVI